MNDYGRVFGEEVASGLGLRSSPLPSRQESIEDYRADPAAAFSRMAELMQPPGGAIPLPFATPLDAREPRPAQPEGE